jgi:hypothetical protein
MTQSDLTLAIQSFDSIKRPDAALALYERVTHNHPSLLGKIPLIALLKALKSSPALAASEGMKIYKSACADTTHFPGLKSDSNTALSLFSSLMASDVFTEQDLSDALIVKDNISQSGVQPASTIYGFLINLAGKAMNYPVALEVYKDMLSCSIPTTTHVESCLLATAWKTKNYSDCWVIYNRIVEDDTLQLQLNCYIVNVMLEVCNRTGETSRGLEIALNWYSSRGMLTWPIIGNIVALCLKSVEEVDGNYDYDDFVRSMTVLHRKNNRASLHRAKSTSISSATASAASSATGSPSSLLFSQEEGLPLYILSIAVEHVVEYLQQQQRRNNSTRSSSRQVTFGSDRSVPSVKHQMEDKVPMYILTTTAPLLLAMGKIDLLFDYIDKQRQRRMIQNRVSSEVEEDDDSSNDTSSGCKSGSMMTGAVVVDDIVQIVRSLWRINNWRYLWSLKHRLEYYRPINDNSNKYDQYVEARIRLITYCLLSMNNSPTDLSIHDESRVEHCMQQIVQELVLYKARPVDLRYLVSTIIDSFICKSRRVDESSRMSNQRMFVAFMSLLMKEQVNWIIAPSIALTEQQYLFVQDSVSSSSLHAHDDVLIQFINSTFMNPHMMPVTNLSQ